MIVRNPTKTIVEDFKKPVESSVKIYMTYKELKLIDYEILDVVHAARKFGIATMVHGENVDMTDWMSDHLEEKGMMAAHHHDTSRLPILEQEATEDSFVPSC